MPEKPTVWFAALRSPKKTSLVTRVGQLLERAGLGDAIADGDFVAIKLHFGEEGNTGFVSPVFAREVVKRVKAHGGKPFLTDANTLYPGQRWNAVDHLSNAIHHGFGYATVEAPIIIADGLNGGDPCEVAIEGFNHFESVRIGSVAVAADAMVAITHVKGHEATGFGGALKNVGMGLGCRSAKQRMHADFKPDPIAEKCTACRRCVIACPVDAITIGPDKVAVVDYELCYGCGECVASCSYGAIAIDWKTTPEAIQEKIVEQCAGVLRARRARSSTCRSSPTSPRTATAGTSRTRPWSPTSACSPRPTSSPSTRPPTTWWSRPWDCPAGAAKAWHRVATSSPNHRRRRDGGDEVCGGDGAGQPGVRPAADGVARSVASSMGMA